MQATIWTSLPPPLTAPAFDLAGGGTWVLTQHPSDKAGHGIALFNGCVKPIGAHAAHIDQACLAAHGVRYTQATYFPAHDFWALQGIETALYGGVAVLLIAFAAWWTHSRAA